MSKIEMFWDRANEYLLYNRPTWREGQCYFNALWDVFPESANKIRGNSDLDPFHVNKNIPAFLEWLNEELNETKICNI